MNVKKREKRKMNKKENMLSISEVKKCSETIGRMREEISKVVVGQDRIVTGLIRGLLCDGHVLVEGVPGIAKTLVVRALGKVTGCKVKRIQFTVDLLPTDIIGITSYTPGKGFEVIKGPIFSNFIIADEINRAPAKVQSALLEAMQEKQVTIGKKTFKLPFPFFVMATENPLEVSGVYLLPEAQIDRFLFKVLMTYPDASEEQKILVQNINLKRFDDFKIKTIITPSKIIKIQNLVKKIYLSPDIEKYIVKIIETTREKKGFELSNFVEWGASPRASIGLFIAAKAEALINGRNYVTPSDVKSIAYDVLRHRLILTYSASVEGINSDHVIDKILKKVAVP